MGTQPRVDRLIKGLVEWEVRVRFLAEPRNDRGEGLGMAGLNAPG